MTLGVVDYPYRSVVELSWQTDVTYEEPFVDLVLDVDFTAPSGEVLTMPGFYDGEQTWRVRFSPDEVGIWRYQVRTRPADTALMQFGEFEVLGDETPGFLQAVPGEAWGFLREDGTPVFLMGDTVYNLFGAAHCGMDVVDFLKRRASQGFNIFRTRCQVSPYHPPEGYSDWQTRRTWPWGGSEQSPRFDRFNLDYFRTVDGVVRAASELGVGFEMIMEAWGFEYPFNNRGVFVIEWEQLWLRYLIARYDAFDSVYVWTLLNEYEYYPDGDWRYNHLADLWAMRTARWLKALAPHGHPIAVHNGPGKPPFAKRFAGDPNAVDAIMFQSWGTTGKDDGWLAAGIEDAIRESLADWGGVAVFAEYGYERNPDLPLSFPGFTYTGEEHNRRGAWRGAFCGLGVMNGFENTWGPVMDLAHDQPGVRYFEALHHFFTEVVPFDRLEPSVSLMDDQEEYRRGTRPLVLASDSFGVIAVYMPTGGDVTLVLPRNVNYRAEWYDPRTGELQPAATSSANGCYSAPSEEDAERPWDWVLVLQSQETTAAALGQGKVVV